MAQIFAGQIFAGQIFAGSSADEAGGEDRYDRPRDPSHGLEPAAEQAECGRLTGRAKGGMNDKLHAGEVLAGLTAMVAGYPVGAVFWHDPQRIISPRCTNCEPYRVEQCHDPGGENVQ